MTKVEEIHNTVVSVHPNASLSSLTQFIAHKHQRISIKALLLRSLTRRLHRTGLELKMSTMMCRQRHLHLHCRRFDVGRLRIGMHGSSQSVLGEVVVPLSSQSASRFIIATATTATVVDNSTSCKHTSSVQTVGTILRKGIILSEWIVHSILVGYEVARAGCGEEAV